MNPYSTLVVPTPDGPHPCRVDLYLVNAVVESFHCSRTGAKILDMVLGRAMNSIDDMRRQSPTIADWLEEQEADEPVVVGTLEEL